MDEITLEIEQLENKLGIPEHFFECLLKEDDWSFVIKAHALIESASTHLLVGFFSVTELEDIFARLELGNTIYGKIVFMKKLNLLTDDERRFIQTLSELRNKVVHNVRNVNFTFKHYISTLDKNQKDNFIRAFGYAYLTDNNGVYKVWRIQVRSATASGGLV
jgi:hypothetical protein